MCWFSTMKDASFKRTSLGGPASVRVMRKSDMKIFIFTLFLVSSCIFKTYGLNKKFHLRSLVHVHYLIWVSIGAKNSFSVSLRRSLPSNNLSQIETFYNYSLELWISQKKLNFTSEFRSVIRVVFRFYILSLKKSHFKFSSVLFYIKYMK